MEKSKSIENFYKHAALQLPESLRTGVGHFDVFRLADFDEQPLKEGAYSRKDYFKVCLLKEPSNVYYADKVVKVQHQALLFGNPQVPYNWEVFADKQTGYFCLFTPAYFYQFGNLQQYEIFQAQYTPVFELNDEQLEKAEQIFLRMFEERASDYVHKDDAIRNLVFELAHLALKMNPAKEQVVKQNAAERMTTQFLALLEKQFPIEDINRPPIALRTPADFAAQLSTHVNVLNRALKSTRQKTTSVIIAARILQEAKMLLKQSNWNIAEIADVLGFTEVTHFNNFFKKQVGVSPSQFRAV